MKFKKGTHVFTADSKNAGILDRVVLDPASGEVTDIIVREGHIFTEDKVVSIKLVGAAENDRVTLLKTAAELQNLPPFEEPYYVPVDDMEHPSAAEMYADSLYLYPPVSGALGVFAYPPNMNPQSELYATGEVQRNTPEGTLAVKEGAPVYTSDGTHVGDIDDVIVDSATNHVTHFAITKGIFFKEHKLIPLSWARKNSEEEIILTVPTDVVNKLPEYKS